MERVPAEKTAEEKWIDAAHDGDIATLNSLLLAKPDLLETKDDFFGMTALHWAVDLGSLQTVQQLISAGANVNAKDDQGLTPLTIAGMYESTEITRVLVAAGAETSLYNVDGRPFVSKYVIIPLITDDTISLSRL